MMRKSDSISVRPHFLRSTCIYNCNVKCKMAIERQEGGKKKQRQCERYDSVNCFDYIEHKK